MIKLYESNSFEQIMKTVRSSMENKYYDRYVSPVRIAFRSKKYLWTESVNYAYDFDDEWFRCKDKQRNAYEYGLALKAVKFTKLPNYDPEFLEDGLSLVFTGKYLPSSAYVDDINLYEVASFHLWVSKEMYEYYLKKYSITHEVDPEVHTRAVSILAKNFVQFINEKQDSWIP